jgi:hypothetical protein
VYNNWDKFCVCETENKGEDYKKITGHDGVYGGYVRKKWLPFENFIKRRNYKKEVITSLL